MSIILNIDTSLESASVSIAKDGAILSVHTNAIQREHASFVHVAINELLAKENLKATDVDAVGVTLGPGSYTGLRVGLSAAKGLCYALNKPLITVGTLEVMAKDMMLQMEKTTDCLFCPMIDARRMEVFTSIYDENFNELVAPHATVLTPQSFAGNNDENMLIFFGSGMSKWKAISKINNALFKENKMLPNALNMLTFQKFILEDFANLSSSIPQYSKPYYTL
jgi:tRNA threonylcarbamoyladenosine biosynthesis protein TsaB